MSTSNKLRIKKEIANNKALKECAVQFGLVGDPTRMKICWLLCKHPELSVGEIAEFLEVSISVVSHSLKRLKIHELVKTRRDRKQVFYRLSNNNFSKVVKKSLINI